MPIDSISLDGVSTDGNQFKVLVTVVFDGNIWRAAEPDNTSHVFATKAGVWMSAANSVTLLAADARTRVGQLHPLVPDTAGPGDIGQGHSFEKAVGFAWRIMTRTAKTY